MQSLGSFRKYCNDVMKRCLLRFYKQWYKGDWITTFSKRKKMIRLYFHFSVKKKSLKKGWAILKNALLFDNRASLRKVLLNEWLFKKRQPIPLSKEHFGHPLKLLGRYFKKGQKLTCRPLFFCRLKKMNEFWACSCVSNTSRSIF